MRTDVREKYAWKAVAMPARWRPGVQTAPEQGRPGAERRRAAGRGPKGGRRELRRLLFLLTNSDRGSAWGPADSAGGRAMVLLSLTGFPPRPAPFRPALAELVQAGEGMMTLSGGIDGSVMREEPARGFSLSVKMKVLRRSGFFPFGSVLVTGGRGGPAL